MDRVRLQHGCHTKGIIIDDLAVVVGSHNWSGDAILEYRDASLIIYDLEAIAYYEKLFSYDWERVARRTLKPSN
jgi:phosphatidylserine/phosphatidylglycerophosphate/cardiolipin synthase-like enzyme